MSDEEIPADGSEVTPTGAVEGPPVEGEEAEGFLGSPWSRRTFLKAAALGTAAAAVFQKGPGFTLGPAAAYANDLSTNPCTANDTYISGNGVVTNEPCDPSSCTDGTFTAIVRFPVHNGTNTGRYCMALHIPGGFGIQAQDVILYNNADGQSGGSTVAPGDSFMYGRILGFPCNFTGSGLECFGTPGTEGRGKCAANECVTVAWTTSPNAAGCTTADQSPPGGQCRHQVICVQRAQASLSCTANCTPTCGQNTTLTATITGLTGPYKYELFSSADNYATAIQTFPASGTTTDTSHAFTVTVTANTSYKVRVTGAGGCFRESGTVAIPAPTGISVSISVSTNAADCIASSASVTFTANVTGASGCTPSYQWQVDGTNVGTGSTYTYPTNPDNTNHVVKVTVTCGGCTACAQRTVKQCVTTTPGTSGACA